ncbi:DUF6733 family protein [Catalinimonas sp. 4WD22]|uniref:DUF6733 family protein n=1 Tax=Catalinimonas locisalis TaxID=3133978 RepID=UPI0031013BFD
MNKTALLTIISCFFLFALPLSSFAQDEDESKLSVGVALNLDAFFGFYPSLVGGYELNDNLDFTFYGIQWGAGTGSAWGNWTEFGVGLNYSLGNLDINPQLGFTMGSLLSSGAAQPGVIGDGIVPNLTMNYGDDMFEGQFYLGYYGALRDETAAGQSTNNYMHYWLNAGVKAGTFMSVGAHYEELFLSGGSINEGGSLESADGYRWLGPYLQFAKGDAGLRFSFGGDLTDDEDSFSLNDFYKMAFFMNF